MQVQVDSQLLRLKELEQAQQIRHHRLQEMAASRQFRETGKVLVLPSSQAPLDAPRTGPQTP